jgi:transcriptional regulator of acetoin/glycerol metabolism
MRLTHSPATADANERKRSALAGVQLCKRQAEEAEARHLSERLRLRDALSAARDQGIPVRVLAKELGISRNAIYKAMERLERAESKR